MFFLQKVSVCTLIWFVKLNLLPAPFSCCGERSVMHRGENSYFYFFFSDLREMIDCFQQYSVQVCYVSVILNPRNVDLLNFYTHNCLIRSVWITKHYLLKFVSILLSSLHVFFFSVTGEADCIFLGSMRFK